MNPELTSLLDHSNHPLREQIEELRSIILNANPGITENLKWNGPNYTVNGQDRITLRVNPPGSLNLILHMGAKAVTMAEPLIRDESRLLVWKSNDRAIMDLKKAVDFQAARPYLNDIVRKWVLAADSDDNEFGGSTT